MRNLGKILVIGFLIIAFIICTLFGFYVYSLPSSDDLKDGSQLEDLFSGFNLKISSKVQTQGITDQMICVSCNPSPAGSEKCINDLSGYIAKWLVDRQQWTEIWHFKNILLTRAISKKYSSTEISRLYFAFSAGAFHADGIGDICKAKFNKTCTELLPKELVALQLSLNSGKLNGFETNLTVNNFQNCFAP